jgi:hypothetical protein
MLPQPSSRPPSHQTLRHPILHHPPTSKRLSPALHRKRQAIQRGRQSFEQSLAVLDAFFNRPTPCKPDR